MEEAAAMEAPYDVVADRHGDVWEVNELSDRVGRLDPRTGVITNYLLPGGGNIRRCSSTTAPRR